jgi:hypothetical protein
VRSARDRHDLDRAPIALIALIVISRIYTNTIGCARTRQIGLQ